MTLTATQIAVLSAAGSFAGALLAAVIAGIYSLLAKQKEYANDYYKKVIERRIAAYEQLERLITSLKTAVLDTDQRPYHLLFAQNDWQVVYNQVYGVMAEALWLSDQAFEKTKAFNICLYHGSVAKIDLIEFGKQNYHQFALLREDLQELLAADMLILHNVKAFLNKKKKQSISEFSPLPAPPTNTEAA